LLAAGCLDLGESRPQELWRKAEALRDELVRWHMVGHLQRNKVRRTLPMISWLHSGDSERLVTAVAETAQQSPTKLPVLLEVNVSGDYSVRFPSLTDEGLSDRYGNGQPSLVYQGSIEAIEGARSEPVLVGRTDQHEAVGELHQDLDEITTARELLKKIQVSCKRNSETASP